MRSISIIKSCNAILPEIGIYENLLGEHYHVNVVQNLERDLSDHIVWCFMGLHRKQPKCRFLIHDYRSLSVGFLSAIKDNIKRRLNAKPDLRIFLNDKIRDIMNFDDEVPSITLDMGVPDTIIQYRGKENSMKYRFCYIGEVSRERKSDRMLNSFLKSPYNQESFLLLGRYEKSIFNQFKCSQSLHFAGCYPQDEVFRMLRQCEYAICHFPNHRPHCFQTPTKMLEYAALGKAIIANKSESNIRTAKELGLKIEWTGDTIFDELILPEYSVDNDSFDPDSIFWKRRFKDSGIWKYLSNS